MFATPLRRAARWSIGSFSFSMLCSTALTEVQAQPCVPLWSNQFSLGDVNGAVFALYEFDPDGSGSTPPDLIAGGTFTTAGPSPAARIARWNGAVWSALGTGLSSAPSDFVAYDLDGAGPNPARLIAGGFFTSAGGQPNTSRVAQWNGTAWSGLGTGVTAPAQDASVSDIEVFDPDGSGPNPPLLIITGFFFTVGGQSLENIAAWNGTSWGPLAGGAPNGTGTALAVFDDDGDGPHLPELYAGGSFGLVGGVSVSNIAKWNGSAWSDVGGGTNANVAELTVYDKDGSGGNPPVLVAAGSFTTAGSVNASAIAQWNGTSWAALGDGLGGTSPGVSSLATFDSDGSGPASAVLVVGGNFSMAGGVSANNIAAWNGTAWSGLSSGTDSLVRAVASFDRAGPTPPVLVAGGFFGTAGGVSTNRIAQWNGTNWAAFGTGEGINGDVNALAFFDEDAGGPGQPVLFAGGAFTNAGTTPANRIARWNGNGWTALGSGMDHIVNALLVYDDDAAGPHQPVLVAGGSFDNAGGGGAGRIAAWNGTAWSTLSGGLGGGVGIGTVAALALFDEDAGGPQPPVLVAGGDFTTADGAPANHVAKWNGSAWSPMGAGLGDDAAHKVHALAVYDADGPGPGAAVLVAGGTFRVPGFFIAQWDGVSWSPLGAGMSDHVFALATFDDNAGTPRLYAGGRFTFAGAVSTIGIARWDGANWSAPAGGLNNSVIAMTVFDEDGAGPIQRRLFAGGVFTTAGGPTVNRIAKWSGSAWSALGSGVGGPGFPYVFALAGGDLDGSGTSPPTLFAGGAFTTAGGLPSARVAAWIGCHTPVVPGDMDCDNDVDASDVTPFIDALLDPASFTGCDITRGDMNADMQVDGGDIHPFVDAVIP